MPLAYCPHTCPSPVAAPPPSSKQEGEGRGPLTAYTPSCRWGGRGDASTSAKLSCNHRDWVWGSLQLGSFSVGSSRTGGAAPSQPHLSSICHNSWIGSWAQGQYHGRGLHKPFPALPVPPRTPSPSLGTKFPRLIHVSKLGTRGCCSAFILTAPARTFSYPRRSWLSPGETGRGPAQPASTHEP